MGRHPYLPLPELRSQFKHAVILDARVGPRRELTLWISRLVWVGNRGHHEEPVTVRFGAVHNLKELERPVARMAADGRHRGGTEIAWLDYSKTRHSKPGHIFVEAPYERTEQTLLVEFGNVTVG